jgi:hypothetical protein
VNDDQLDVLSLTLAELDLVLDRPSRRSATVDELPDPGPSADASFGVTRLEQLIGRVIRDRVPPDLDHDNWEIVTHVDPARLVEGALEYAYQHPGSRVWVVVPTELHMGGIAELLGRPLDPPLLFAHTWVHDVPVGESLIQLWRVTAGWVFGSGPVHHVRWLVDPEISARLEDRHIAKAVRFALAQTRRAVRFALAQTRGEEP